PHRSSAPQPSWATFPRLRGQSGLYVAKELGDFKSGLRGGSSNAKVMHGIASTLGDDDVQALSTWLNAL
ncbi:cytochrome c4, partial [Rhodanobacter denitrificans]|nr:cytochrome c4 [Rhodanobacter denitrificans]